MADLAVGLSKIAIEALADKVKSAIKEEAEQWQIMQRDPVYITGEFEMMQSFLNTADGEHIRNSVVRTWVGQVRDLSYDVEDCIEFVLHLDTKQSWWLRLLPSCKARAALPLDEAVTEITQLKVGVVDVSQRNTRYNLISESGSKPLARVQETAAASMRTFDILTDVTKKWSGFFDLAGLITMEDKELQVISVYGAGGDVGKISMIKKVYGDSRIHKKFQRRAWVKLMHPFNPHEFIQSLVAQFYTNSCQVQEEAIVGLDVLTRMEASQGDLLKEFAQNVNMSRYLIILEDLSTMVQWNAIKTCLPDRMKGSQIVVLTHQLEIASLCTGQPCRVSVLRQYAADHPIYVFFKEGLQHDKRGGHSITREARNRSMPNIRIVGHQADELFGRSMEVDELFQNIKECHLISVCGIPSVGKSVLVKAAYRKHTWVSVSHPFNPMDFSQGLLSNLNQQSASSEEVNSEALEAEDPIKECQKLLDECACLVVIDCLQSKEDWNWIKANIITEASRSCIVIITSDESVAKHCAISSNNAVYHVKGLGADTAFELFKQSMSNKIVQTSSSMTSHQHEVFMDTFAKEAKPLLPKCGGLPRVIVTSLP